MTEDELTHMIDEWSDTFEQKFRKNDFGAAKQLSRLYVLKVHVFEDFGRYKESIELCKMAQTMLGEDPNDPESEKRKHTFLM